MEESLDLDNQELPTWAVFGDLMAGLVGVFILLLVWVISYQMQLSISLQEQVHLRETEQQRRIQLEKTLSNPLSSGRITLLDGRIGINGSVLFALNSDQLQAEGRELLQELVQPLIIYLGERDELLMVSGFTDDLPIQEGNRQFSDNWELSAQRALTVTRALVESGMPARLIFAAAFGQHQPVATNTDNEGRAKNRRVEIAPVPKTTSTQGLE